MTRSFFAGAVVMTCLALACAKRSDVAAHSCDADAGPCYSVDLPEGRVTLNREEVRSRSREAYIQSAYPDKRANAIRTFEAIVAATPPGTGEHDEAARVLKSLRSE